VHIGADRASIDLTGSDPYELEEAPGYPTAVDILFDRIEPSIATGSEPVHILHPCSHHDLSTGSIHDWFYVTITRRTTITGVRPYEQFSLPKTERRVWIGDRLLLPPSLPPSLGSIADVRRH
jgi:hypothetical protein